MPSRCSRPLPIGAMPSSVRDGRSPSRRILHTQFTRNTLLRKSPIGAAPGAWPRVTRNVSDAPLVCSFHELDDDLATSVQVVGDAPEPESESVKLAHEMEHAYAKGEASAEVEKAAQIYIYETRSEEVLEEVAFLETCEKVGLSTRMRNFEGASRSTSPSCSTASAEVSLEGEETAQIDTYTPSSREVLGEVAILEKSEKALGTARRRSFEGSSRSTSPGCSTTSAEVCSDVEQTAQIDTDTPSSNEVLEEVAFSENCEKEMFSARRRNFEGSSRSTSPGCSTNAPSSPSLSHAKALDLKPMYILEPMYVQWESTCMSRCVQQVKMPEFVLDLQRPAFVQVVGTPQMSQEFDLTLLPNSFYDSNMHAAGARTQSGASTPTQPPCDAVFASVGSMHHFKGSCKPCAFVHTVGCANGDRCSHCHLCAPGEKLRRRQNWRLAHRQNWRLAAKQLRQ